MQRSPEDFERHVCDALIIRLPAHLTALNDAYRAQDQADGLADPDGTSWVEQRMVAPDPTITVGYFPGGLDVVTAWPSIEAAVPDDDYTEFALGQLDARVTLRLIVQIHLQDPRFQVLNRLMKRYAAAVTDALTEQGALGDSSIQELRRAWRTDPENPDQNVRIAGGCLIFFSLETAQVRM